MPALVYWWVGFCTVLVALSPKAQDQEVGVLVEESVKVTLSGAVPEVGVPEKLATGAGVPVASVRLSRTRSKESW